MRCVLPVLKHVDVERNFRSIGRIFNAYLFRRIIFFNLKMLMDNRRRVSNGHGLKERRRKIVTAGHLARELGCVGAPSTAGQSDAMRKLSTRYADIK